MAKSQTATTHPKAAPNQLLLSAMATLASKLNSASIVKKKVPASFGGRSHEFGSSPVCRGMGHLGSGRVPPSDPGGL
jgi:hypothetical protein